MVVRLPSKRQAKGVEGVSAFLAIGAKAVQGHLFIAFVPPYASALAAICRGLLADVSQWWAIGHLRV
jgi:hypothetical protein